MDWKAKGKGPCALERMHVRLWKDDAASGDVCLSLSCELRSFCVASSTSRHKNGSHGLLSIRACDSFGTRSLVNIPEMRQRLLSCIPCQRTVFCEPRVDIPHTYISKGGRSLEEQLVRHEFGKFTITSTTNQPRRSG